MTKAMGVLFAGLMLVGCATTKPKPDLSDKNKEHIIAYWVVTHKCHQYNLVSTVEAATGINMLKAELNKYSYDPGVLNKTIHDHITNSQKPTEDACKLIARLIEENKQALDSSNRTRAQTTDTELVKLPVNTTCNKIGTQTFCSTY